MSIFSPVRQHVDRKLRLRLRAFLGIWFILLLVVAVDVLRQKVDTELAFIGFFVGLLAGVFLSRMYRLDWDEATTRVVYQLDLIGKIILAVYVLFMIGRNWLFGYWVEASDLMGFVLSFTAGTMIGRVAATRRGIRHTLYALRDKKSEEEA